MKSPAKISILVPDISSPVLGAATMLAGHLEHVFEVDVVGPDLGHGVCWMYRNTRPYRIVRTPRLYRFPDFVWESRRLSRELDGDCIIAIKAYADTVPLAWLEKRRRGAKALVYLDEWDGALYHAKAAREKLRAVVTGFYRPLDDLYHPLVEKLIPRLDGVLSTTTFLQRKFGGNIIHFGVDTEIFSPPESAVTEQLRQDCGIGNGRCLVFGGVVRPHKGIELILDALALIGNPAYRLVVVGPVNEHLTALLADVRYQPHLVALGPKTREEMPLYLSMADAVVLPLFDNLLARSQMPCKVFEAMAMAKPIIGTAVADLPLVLEGCGKIVPPDNVEVLALAIRDVFADDALAAEMGRQARAKCIREYSKDVTSKKLLGIVGEILGGSG